VSAILPSLSPISHLVSSPSLFREKPHPMSVLTEGCAPFVCVEILPKLFILPPSRSVIVLAGTLSTTQTFFLFSSPSFLLFPLSRLSFSFHIRYFSDPAAFFRAFPFSPPPRRKYHDNPPSMFKNLKVALFRSRPMMNLRVRLFLNCYRHRLLYFFPLV